MKRKTTKVKCLLRLFRIKVKSLLWPTPEVVATHLQAENIVKLLRKQYSLQEQNKILLDCGERMLALREEDRRELVTKLEVLNTETMSLALALNLQLSK